MPFAERGSRRLLAASGVVVWLLLAQGCATAPERRSSDALTEIHRDSRYGAEDAERVSALPALGEGASLDDYLAYAALQDRGLEAAFYRWKAALERVPGARALPDPTLTYAFFIQRVETRVGPQIQRFGLMQRIPWPGKLTAAASVAMAAADVERRKYEAAKVVLFERVKAAYYDYWFLRRAIDVSRENMELLSYLETVARARYTVGKAPHAALVRAQLELGRLEDRIKSLEALRVAASARLEAIINRPPGEVLPWPAGLPDTPVAWSEEELFTGLAESNPELRIAAARIAAEEERIRLARRGYFPDFALGVDFIHTGAATMPGVVDSGKDPVVAMVTVSLPLWFSKYDAALGSAKAMHSAATAERADMESMLRASLRDALYRFDDAERKVSLYSETLLPKAEESLNVSRVAFEGGDGDFLDVLDAERILLEFRLQLDRARADRVKAIAEVERLVGKELGHE